jgi:hypothetical protein
MVLPPKKTLPPPKFPIAISFASSKVVPPTIKTTTSVGFTEKLMGEVVVGYSDSFNLPLKIESSIVNR